MLPSVALVGKQGSGKSSVAGVLTQQHQYLRHSWADGVRAVFSMAYDSITPQTYSLVKAKLYDVRVMTPDGPKLTQKSGGELLQQIGTEALRNQIDLDFWIKSGMRRVIRADGMVNDDTRFLNEAEALRGRGWVVVRVTAPDDLRQSRIGAAFRPEGHASETEQERIAEDYVLNNDGERSIDLVVAELTDWMQTLDNDWMSKAERALADGVI